jgi:four helix bundle protein
MNVKAIRTFRDLDAWNVAMELAVACYGITARLPFEERFGLSSQIRRAAVSIAANIAEGHASGRDGVLARQLRIALGSLGELDTDLELLVRLDFVRSSDLGEVCGQLARTGQLLHGFARSIRAKRVKRALCWCALASTPYVAYFAATAFVWNRG